MASYSETIFHLAPSVMGALIACNPKGYAESGDGVLCRDFAGHMCPGETR